MRLLLLICCISLFSSTLFSQEVLWSKNYGGSKYDILSSIKQQIDSTYIVVGFTESNDFDLKNTLNTSEGDTDGWVLKIDADGNIIWSKKYGGSGHDIISKIQLDSDGLIFLGQTQSNDIANTTHKGNSDVWIFKTDFEGNILWSKLYGSAGAEGSLSLLLTKDSTLIITASSNSKGGDVPDNFGGFDLWVFEIDLMGNLLWSNVFGGSGDDPNEGRYSGYNPDEDGEILYVQNEGYIITSNSKSGNGHLDGNAGVSDNWVLCINEEGELKWSHSVGSEDFDAFVKAEIINDDLILFSNTHYSISGVAVYEMFNDQIGFRNHIGPIDGNNKLTDGEYTAQQKLIFSGLTSSDDFDLHTYRDGIYSDGWVIQLNSKADLEWSKNYGGSAIDGLNKIEIIDTSEILAIGYSNSDDYDLPNNYGSYDGWIIKIKDCITKTHKIDTFMCSNSFLLFHGDTIDLEGVYRDTFTAETGCDSIIAWNVEVYGEDVDSSINDSFCKSYTLPSGNVIDQSGTYLDTLISSFGCDSIIEFILEKEIFVRDTIDVQKCEFYMYRNGQVVRTDGYVTDTIFNSTQCDSIITYTIEIIELDTTALVLKKEEGQTVRFRDTVFTLPGKYIYRQEKAEGCDRIYLIEVKEYKDCELYIPNAFSPNGDDINDLFSVSVDAACELFNFRALIFDRWGQKVAESRNPLFIWDGAGYPSGVYVYFITYEYEGAKGIQSKQETGDISIVR